MVKTNNSVLSWSGGKDACLALYYSKEQTVIRKLITSISSEFQRISMHGVPLSLLKKQVDLLGMELQTYELPEGISMQGYNDIITTLYTDIKSEGIDSVIFGDLFLEDLRNYREQQTEKHGLQATFPLWTRDTKKLAVEFIELGFKAIVVAASDKKLGKTFCGVPYDLDFLNKLPSDVDPCGENGEFHTFVYDGPVFSKPVPFTISGIKAHNYTEAKEKNWDSKFWFCDLE